LGIGEAGEGQTGFEGGGFEGSVVEEGVHEHVHVVVMVDLIHLILVKRRKRSEDIELVHLRKGNLLWLRLGVILLHDWSFISSPYFIGIGDNLHLI
jgi:hypothetical protein